MALLLTVVSSTLDVEIVPVMVCAPWVTPVALTCNDTVKVAAAFRVGPLQSSTCVPKPLQVVPDEAL